jgi:hypothetical protein
VDKVKNGYIEYNIQKNYKHKLCGQSVCQSRKGFESPDESGHEVRHDPDTLASSPDRYKGR